MRIHLGSSPSSLQHNLRCLAGGRADYSAFSAQPGQLAHQLAVYKYCRIAFTGHFASIIALVRTLQSVTSRLERQLAILSPQGVDGREIVGGFLLGELPILLRSFDIRVVFMEERLAWIVLFFQRAR